MNCLKCGTKIGLYNWKYCSVKCRNKSIASLPRGTFRRTNMICRECAKNYTIRNSQKKRSRFCSRQCQGKALARSTNGTVPNDNADILHFWCHFLVQESNEMMYIGY